MEILSICIVALVSLLTLVAVWHVETQRFNSGRISWLFTAYVRGTLILTGILILPVAAISAANVQNFRMFSNISAETSTILSSLSFFSFEIVALFFSLGPGGSLGMLVASVRDKRFRKQTVILGCGQPQHTESVQANAPSPVIRRGEIVLIVLLSLLGWLCALGVANALRAVETTPF